MAEQQAQERLNVEIDKQTEAQIALLDERNNLISELAAMTRERDEAIASHSQTVTAFMYLQKQYDELQATLASYADTVERVRTIESHIRETCGVELNVLSNMGIGFVEKAVKWYQATLAAREAQLPKEMPDCTIVFKECPLGHGRLTATNWIDRGCVICERDAAVQETARLRVALEAVLPIVKEVAAIEQAQAALKGQH